jgi:hypothetical protein
VLGWRSVSPSAIPTVARTDLTQGRAFNTPLSSSTPSAVAANPTAAVPTAVAPVVAPTPTTGTNLSAPALGPEVFAAISQELSIPAATPHQGNVGTAVTDAIAGGFVDPQGAPNIADLAVHTHGHASIVRQILGVTGAQANSGHIGPTSALRNVTDYSRSGAETTLLDPVTHAAFDNFWKNWAMNMRRAGRTDCTVAELYQTMLQAIDQIPGMPQRTRNAIAWRLQLELFRDLGLLPQTRIRLPYPNIPPTNPPAPTNPPPPTTVPPP